jgi:hypothetical protein
LLASGAFRRNTWGQAMASAPAIAGIAMSMYGIVVSLQKIRPRR